MSAILGMCIVLGLGFVGIGAWFYRAERIAIGWAFWLGWAMTIGILQLWHFFAPINDSARVAWLGLAGISLLIHHRRLLDAIRPITRTTLLWGGLSLLIALWLSNRATFSDAHFSAFGFDSGFYHIPTIMWFSEHPIIIGLGNVHTRFGFSNAYFLYGALVNWDIFAGKSYQVMNTLLYAVFFSQMVWSIIALFRRDENCMEHAFRVLCTPFVIFWLLLRYEENLGVPSSSNDVPIFILSILLGGKLITHTIAKHITLSNLIRIGVLVATGIAVKFNFIFGAGLLLVALALFVWRNHRQWRIGVASLMLIGCAILIPMGVRSILMTGYPLFPLTIAGLDVDWRVPSAIAQIETGYIQTFARVLGNSAMYETLVNNPQTDWFSFWLERSALDYPVMFYGTLLLIASGIIGMMIAWVMPKARLSPAPTITMPWLGLLLVGIGSVAFWFINAPLWRLSVGVTWFFGAGICVFAWQFLRPRLMQFATIAMMLGLTGFVLIDGTTYRGVSLDFVSAEPQPIPPLWIEQWETAFGLTVNVSQDWLCWDYIPPCVPKVTYSPLLRERVFGDMTHGYRSESVAVLFDPATHTIETLSETFTALQNPQETRLTFTITSPNQPAITESHRILAPLLDTPEEPPYALLLGTIALPTLPSGDFALYATWGASDFNLAERWQIASFRFDDLLQITDTVIHQQENRLTVQLVGEALQAIPSRYHVAVWLRHADGRAYQHDVSPLVPTHDWQMGGRYLITARFDNIPHGEYTLSVIWYDVFSDELTRLQGYDANGTPLGDDVTLIGILDL